MTTKPRKTRFRAYQLGSPGSSFSYFDGSRFALIEGRLVDQNIASIDQELELCGCKRVNTLHITSWDQDHCVPGQIEQIVERYNPSTIQYPGYEPHTQSGKDSKKLIEGFKLSANGPSKVVQITPAYIKSLDSSSRFGYNDILYHPKSISSDNSNDNSTVKQFRSGSFNVLSLGDVESSHLAAGLRTLKTINSEVDVMILAHHGADNGFTTSSFIKTVRPTIAIASADYSNKFEHPKPAIRSLLHKWNVRLFTTKTGDIIVRSIGTHTGDFEILNLQTNSTELSSAYRSVAKKRHYLNMNRDAIRSRYTKRNRGPR